MEEERKRAKNREFLTRTRREGKRKERKVKAEDMKEGKKE